MLRAAQLVPRLSRAARPAALGRPTPTARGLARVIPSHLANLPHVDLLLDKSKVTAPVSVRNIYCIGRNYAEHATELGNAVPNEAPVIFLKSSASIRPLDDGYRPHECAFDDEPLHFEAELVLLVGSHVPLASLREGRETECLQGFGLGLDLTRRGVQSELKREGKPWTLAKSFAGSAVVTTMQRCNDPSDLDVGFSLVVNGAERQHGHVSQMIFDIPFQLRYLNSFTGLLPGDLVFTGTPAGVGECRRGDQVALTLHHDDGRKDVRFKGVL